jgi:hypothetical protein
MTYILCSPIMAKMFCNAQPPSKAIKISFLKLPLFNVDLHILSMDTRVSNMKSNLNLSSNPLQTIQMIQLPVQYLLIPHVMVFNVEL